MKSTRVVKCAVGLMAMGMAGVACSERTTQTELEPEGPPVIKQVLMEARVPADSNTRMTQLAYGSHPDINDSTSIDEFQVTVGPVQAALATNNRIRVVFDELLVGNYLEEIACNGVDVWSHVPRGADPDDIAACSGRDPAALVDCTGDHAVCITEDGPVGILDADDDGAVDDMRMKRNTLFITCDGTDVVWHREQSFYQPAGNQLISPGPLGVDALGPAIIIVPVNPAGVEFSGMRTGSQCSLTFKDLVIDKDNNRVCAPAEGSECVPGDTSGISWTVEPLRMLASSPANNGMNVALGNPNSTVTMQFNTSIDPQTIAGITVGDANGTFPDCDEPPVGQCLQRTRSATDTVQVIVVGGFTPESLHTVTLPTSLTDVFGGALPAEVTFQFTTRAAP